jgi:hypothetical protein
MSHPLPGEAFTVDPDGLQALADELGTLAAALSGDVGLARSAAGCFSEGLGGHEGWNAGATATAWACLYDVMAARTRALAGTLTAAVTAYVAEDAWLASALASGGPPR